MKTSQMSIVHCEQHSRAYNLEIKGVPVIANENLNETLRQLGEAIGERIDTADVEICHRVRTRERGKQNIVDRVLAKARSKRIMNEDLGLSADSPVFINEHLCPTLKKLLGKTIAKKRDAGWKFAWAVGSFTSCQPISPAIQTRMSQSPNHSSRDVGPGGARREPLHYSRAGAGRRPEEVVEVRSLATWTSQEGTARPLAFVSADPWGEQPPGAVQDGGVGNTRKESFFFSDFVLRGPPLSTASVETQTSSEDLSSPQGSPSEPLKVTHTQSPSCSKGAVPSKEGTTPSKVPEVPSAALAGPSGRGRGLSPRASCSHLKPRRTEQPPPPPKGPTLSPDEKMDASLPLSEDDQSLPETESLPLVSSEVVGRPKDTSKKKTIPRVEAPKAP
ncbi:uncharacterized protein ISCGN_002999 [Ixodes scapularis]